jgi:hypothetical protein
MTRTNPFLWGEHPTSNRTTEYYCYHYESTCTFNCIDALVWWWRFLPRWTVGRWRWVWTHFTYPPGFAFYGRTEQEITLPALNGGAWLVARASGTCFQQTYMIKSLIFLCFAELTFLPGPAQAVTPTPAVIKISHVTTKYAPKPISSGRRLARVTAYWAAEGDYNTRHLLSATGVRLRGGHCAVDPRIIPYGSMVEVAGIGIFLAVDTGSAVVSRKAAREDADNSEEGKALVIDLFFESRKSGQTFAATSPKYASISWWTPSLPSTLSSVPVITPILMLLRLGLAVHPLRLPDEIAPISMPMRLGLPAHPLRSQVEVATQ